MEAATLYLQRDSTGHANWQLSDPARPRRNENMPIIRNLTMPNAHVILNDDLHHLKFDGSVSAEDLSGEGPLQPMRLTGGGQLNGRPVTFEISGDPLATTSHKNPYRFTFSERSSGTQLTGKGALPRPFQFDVVDATFQAAGPDLKDLYFLTGVHLLDTGVYRLSGTISRRGAHTTFSDLVATTGQSDMRGTVSADSSGARRRLTVDLNSQYLRLSDLGPRAAGRASDPKPPLLLSDAMLSPEGAAPWRCGSEFSRPAARYGSTGHLPGVGQGDDRSQRAHGRAAVGQILGGTASALVRLDATQDIRWRM